MVDYRARGACEACKAAVVGSGKVFVEVEYLDLQTRDGGIERVVICAVSTDASKVEWGCSDVLDGSCATRSCNCVSCARISADIDRSCSGDGFRTPVVNIEIQHLDTISRHRSCSASIGVN